MATTKSLQVGESVVAGWVITVLSLVAFGAVVFFMRYELRPVPRFTAGVLAMIPFGFIRRRFGFALLSWGEAWLRFQPHGPLWFGRVYPAETIRSVVEHRLSGLDEQRDPIWSLVLELTDGTRVQLGSFRDKHIHDLVAELNDFIAQRMRKSVLE